jgi:choline dehydrogenase-like flavoprotein
MHVNAATLPDNSVIEGDICIIGSGAAGLSMALDWIGTPDKVILLEGGGFEYEDKIQELYAGKTTGQKYFPLKSARLHFFGGTTGHWSGFCSTFDEIDFEKRDWVPHSGWPITRADLDPYYKRAHTIVELGPYEYDWKYWQKKDPSWKPLLQNESVIWNKIWQFSPPTQFGKKYKEAIVNAPNIHLFTYANVVDITANENATAVSSVTVKNHAGRQHIVKAKHFVLACCAIQNARLLLASNKQATKGLGNDHDNVGRYFMEHLEMQSAELSLLKSDPLKMYALDFPRTKARCELAVSADMQRKHRILNGTSSLTPLAIASRTKPMIDVWSTDDPEKNLKRLYDDFGEADRKGKSAVSEEDLTKAYSLFTRIEQAPNPNSRVMLDTEKDALGVPRVTLHWELTALEKTSMRKIYELIGAEVGKEGIGRLRLMEYLRDANDYSWPEITGGGWHHMGTTRMSDDPKNGVVDKHCKVHGMTNLHVAGSSVYVTAASPNPTLTLMALSLRLSDRIKSLI